MSTHISRTTPQANLDDLATPDFENTAPRQPPRDPNGGRIDIKVPDGSPRLSLYEEEGLSTPKRGRKAPSCFPSLSPGPDGDRRVMAGSFTPGSKAEAGKTYIGPTTEFGLFDLLKVPYKTLCGKKAEELDDGGHHGPGHGPVDAHEEKLRQEALEENEGDPTNLWFGLFTDLIFVAVVVAFANQMKAHVKGFFLDTNHDWLGSDHSYQCKKMYYAGAEKPFYDFDGFECYKSGGSDAHTQTALESLLFFFCFWVCWLELTAVLARFVNLEGMLDDLLMFLFLSGVITMAIQMDSHKPLTEHRLAFTCGLMTSILSMMFLHVMYYYLIEDSRKYSKRRVWSYGLSVIIMGVGVMIDTYEAYIACLTIGIFITFWVSLTSFLVQHENEVTVEHFVERFGILVMIVTGESILALILGDSTDSFKQQFEDYCLVFLSFSIMYVVKDIYFQSTAEEEDHALMEDSMPGSCSWVFLHFPLTYFLLTAGVGFKLMFTQLGEDDLEKKYAGILGFSLSLVILTMLVIRTAHKKFIFQSWVSYATRLPTVCMIPIGIWVCNDPNGYTGWCLFFIAASYAWDLIILEKFEIDMDVKKRMKKEEEEKEHALRAKHNQLGAENPPLCKRMLSFFPGCNNAEMKAWDQAGFQGPPEEIALWWLPVDFVTCRIEEGWRHLTSSVKRGNTGVLKDIGQLHSEDGREHDASKDWLGEFSDLIFVAVIVKFADQIKYTTKDVDGIGFDKGRVILESALFFYGFYVVWLEMTVEFIRFRNMPGIVDDILRFSYLLGIVTMAVQIDEKQYMTVNIDGYLAGYLLCLGTQCFQHFIYWARIARARRYARWRVVSYFTCSLLLVVGILVDSLNIKITFILVISSLLTYLEINSFRVTFKEDGIPNEGRRPDNEPFIERFGLLVMITTGESILAIILGSDDFKQQWDYYMLVYLAFTVMFYIKEVYFASNCELENGHALEEEGTPGAVVWVLCHGILAYCLLGCGVGFKLFFAVMPDDPYPHFRYIMVVCVAGALSVMLLIRLAHDKFIFHPLGLSRLPVIAGIILGAAFIEDPNSLSAWTAAGVVLIYMLDHFIMEKYETKELEDGPHHRLEDSADGGGGGIQLTQKNID